MSEVRESVEREVRIPSGRSQLSGFLAVPAHARGIVLFVHGSGSSRHSPRNMFVARALQRGSLGTLLFDLLTPEEEERDALTREHRFDIALLSRRLVDATRWVASDQIGDLPAGYFGASTGSAGALVAAAALGPRIAAIVSRGGRPDLAHETVLARVTAATLLIVGSRDHAVIEMNKRAYEHLRAPKDLAIVAGASHLFEEPGALDEVALLAADWFRSHFTEHERRS